MKMYNIALILCLAAQGSNFGKTDTQILSMGRQGWMDFYTSKKGDSTLDMCEAERAYGQVLARRNDKAIKKADRAFVRQLRPALTMFQQSVYEVGGALSAGGTIWNLFHAGIGPDVEHVVGIVVGLRGSPAPSRVTSDVQKALDALSADVRANSREIEAMKGAGGGVEAARKGLMGARLAFAELAQLAAKRPRAQSDAILEFCVQGVKDVRVNGT